ncbi:hypothetical protein OSH39_02710 [Mycobacterium ulcerans]|uniref:Lipoprotein n=2 Tax=Mycobacterium ulcerans TaxID=1809 RepID=A0ABY3VA41_MYCUL|nr:hypothetical protein [Mycobacterium ulcerans]ABL05968.1 conserved hypothetical secreted protein [Mycobacterium ulcerans Agy99]MEB3904238.1 hypothetical protein [Mycobacterium ulcerans]MEB3908351.1 hypothetical protein [Mycobacterium ulcerans]MEB3918651.1 hypothetical protein [Mycobacterium ulcerans]MEB3922807.1 hypothetical protein [Mycobacterium ulcerans]
MALASLSGATAGIVACTTACVFAAPTVADPGDQIPGNGVFLVGTDMLPGTYRTEGPANPLILVFGRVSELSTCSWSTPSTPAANTDDIIDTNTSMGPMSVVIPPTVAAFQTMNCKLWMRVG